MQTVRLPAFPLITSDPFLSIWSCADVPTRDDTRHWAGERKRLTLVATIDGKPYALLGRIPGLDAATMTGCEVTPTKTTYAYEAGGVALTLSFTAPLLMDDFDLLSTPVTFINVTAKATDGGKHTLASRFALHDDLCYQGMVPQPMVGDNYQHGPLAIAYMGKKQQNLLAHSGDHTTIDWGYAYLAAKAGVAFERDGGHYVLSWSFEEKVGAETASHDLLLAYDDVASINYFGRITKAWYARNGATIIDALLGCDEKRADILARCAALDAQLLADARTAGCEAYARVIAASYRHSICAHKLIADEEGKAIFFSKENDSNGCMGTADVSYPSIPLYLLYAPELVRAMCRPVLRFAAMPVWQYDFAPHDVGRYPQATGQVYGLKGNAYGNGLIDRVQNAESHPPLYLYRTDKNIYDLRFQMPVEECGNMILMMAASMRADGDDTLVREGLPLLRKWVEYLKEYGEDPGEQLCTDDFAGHLAHNVNLAFKAVYGIAAYAWMMERIGEADTAKEHLEIARKMAATVYANAKRGDHTSLTLDGDGWSLKYNAIWDILFQFNFLGEEFFTNELAQYARMENTYGVPLDSRADYTKSDWILWVATTSGKPETVEAMCKPLVKYLEESPTRIAFGDWYDTKTARFCHFIARSVQGGLYMPLLRKQWGV